MEHIEQFLRHQPDLINPECLRSTEIVYLKVSITIPPGVLLITLFQFDENGS